MNQTLLANHLFCEHCEKNRLSVVRFKSSQEKTIHIDAVHQKQTAIVCPHCGLRASSELGKLRHVQVRHPNEAERVDLVSRCIQLGENKNDIQGFRRLAN